MNVLERARMRWEARRELRAIVQEDTGPGSLARRAVERLSLRRSIVRALRSPVLPAVAGAAVLAGIACVLVGVVIGLALTAETGAT